tara:strand:- start:3225 stop:3551 length:327 start_codon:yes stop_codon:yes gene_type:complete
MFDIASVVFGDFQDSIVATFGDTLGWLVGHALIVGTAALIWFSWGGRDHIREKSGWDKSTLFDMTTVAALTLAQYAVFTGTFGFPVGPSLGVAFGGAMFARWCVNILN